MAIVTSDTVTGASDSGLLIVNADDWGGWNVATDNIARAYEHGSITSSTAMVYMDDSARAADIAGELRIPLGLHLNLTQPFDGPDVPSAARERQQALCGRFWSENRRRRTLLDPRASMTRL